MSITKWFAIGGALTFGTSGLTLGAARAGDPSADAVTVRAFHGGSAVLFAEPARSGDPVRSNAGTETELVALGASDGANDAATARAKPNAGEEGLAPAIPMGLAVRADERLVPLGASDGASDAHVARAGRSSPTPTTVAEDGGRTGESNPPTAPLSTIHRF